MEKNQLVTVKIEDMTESGEGIGKVDGYTLFLKDAVIGDVVEAKVIKAKKTYGYARVMEVKEASPCRVEPRCPVAGPCGGCQLQAMSYESQMEWKRKKVREHLIRIGGMEDPKVLPVLGMEDPWEYRNKAQFPVGRDKNGEIVAGFYAARSHRIVETERCFLGSPVNEEILGIVKRWMKENRVEPYDEESGRGLVRHVLIRESEKTGQIMVCLVINGKRVPAADRLVERLRETPGMTSISLNVNQERTNVILGKQLVPLFGPLAIEDRIGENRYRISPLAFYQVNKRQTEVLYRTALKYAGLTGEETVWDLYCGTGTIGMTMASKAGKVIGVEVVPDAIEDAKANAVRNGVKNIEFICGDSAQAVQMLRKRGERPTVVVVDPPRKGCGLPVLEHIVEIAPRKIVYVSCDPATLARDLKLLVKAGYCLQTLVPVDLFPRTAHVETVALLEKADINLKN